MPNSNGPSVYVYETAPRLVLAWRDDEDTMVVLDPVTRESVTVSSVVFTRLFRPAAPAQVGLLATTTEEPMRVFGAGETEPA